MAFVTMLTLRKIIPVIHREQCLLSTKSVLDFFANFGVFSSSNHSLETCAMQCVTSGVGHCVYKIISGAQRKIFISQVRFIKQSSLVYCGKCRIGENDLADISPSNENDKHFERTEVSVLEAHDNTGEDVGSGFSIPCSKKQSVLEPPSELKDVDVLAPQLRPTFTFAAYINKSHTLQQLVKLGVNLSKWEKKKEVVEFILPLDFEQHLQPHITFLFDNNVPAEKVGWFLTVNPFILKEPLDNLQIRLNYLTSKKFSAEDISRIITKNPSWLLYSTVEIDRRLGFFQKYFELTGSEVRHLATRHPKLITHDEEGVKARNFIIKEEMGFEVKETKALLLKLPRLWTIHAGSLKRRFYVAHNIMNLSHAVILDFPQILTCRDYKLLQRHRYLNYIRRDQYEPTKPNYISPLALISGTDLEFCQNVAKTSIGLFNDFLKTL